MENLVRAICQQEGLSCQAIRPLSGGQVNQVFLVDDAYVVRLGSRSDAFQRLKRETDLLRSLSGKVPVPQVYAFGQRQERVYQIQQVLPGRKLYSVWMELSPLEQENLVAELAGHLKTLHRPVYPYFGSTDPDAPACTSWLDYLSHKLQRTLDEIKDLNLRMMPGFLELASNYFDENKPALQAGVPTLVHSDLSMMNILVDHGSISALLDFEYALHAPADYELWVMEAFCLYPTDYTDADQQVFCSADFASFLPLLRKHYPALFEIPSLRVRLNLYHLVATLSSYLAWRKDHLDTLPPDRMAAREFYMARITNFISTHNGARMI